MSTHDSHPREALIARAAWSALALIHAPIAVSSVLAALTNPAVEHVTGMVVVLTATAFFLAKAIDVPALRFRATRHSLLLLVVAAAVAHHETVVEALDEGPITPAALVGATTLGLTIRLWRRNRRRMAEWLRRTRPVLAQPWAVPVVTGMLAPVVARGGPGPIRRYRPSRAPPARV